MRIRFDRFPAGRPFGGFVPGLVIAAIFVITGCTENPTFLGRDLLPPSDNIIIRTDSSTMVDAWTIRSRPVITTISNRLLLGTLNDNIFGYSRAQFMVPLHNLYNKDLETGREVDSLILTLKVEGFYGDATARTVRVYQVTSDIVPDSAYYSNTDPSQFYDPVELGSGVFHPSSDTTTIRIPITNQDYINKFLTTNDSVFNDPEDFESVFKGLFITTDTVTEGRGSIAYINIEDADNVSGLRLYFKNDTTRLVSDSVSAVYPMLFSNNSPKANFFSHDHADAMVAGYLGKKETNDTLLFTSGMAGLSVRLDFPGIEKWLDSTRVAINKAELIIPADSTFVNTSDFPDKLVLWTVDKNGKYDYVYDNLIDQSSGSSGGVIFNGYYNDIEKNAYVFNIGFHLQKYIQGETEKMEFILLPSQNSTTAKRTVLKGPGSAGPAVRLKIIYTEL